jgi:ABC-type multidrug transport system fused ATPase/permease subunit
VEEQKAKEGRSGEGTIDKPDQNVESKSRQHTGPDGDQGGPGGAKGRPGRAKAGPGDGRGRPGGANPAPPARYGPSCAGCWATCGPTPSSSPVSSWPPWRRRPSSWPHRGSSAGVDRFILEGQAEQVWWAAGGLLALSLVQGGIDFLRLYLTAYTGQRIVFEIRNAIFEHLSRLSFSFYDRARTGDLMSRVTADVDVLNNFFGRAAVIILTNLLTLLGILVVLMIWDWRLGWSTWACCP